MVLFRPPRNVRRYSIPSNLSIRPSPAPPIPLISSTSLSLPQKWRQQSGRVLCPPKTTVSSHLSPTKQIWQPWLEQVAHPPDTNSTSSHGHFSSCRGRPNFLTSQWIQLFLLRKPFPPSTTAFWKMGQRYLTAADADPYSDLLRITREEYDELFALANREYNSIVAGDNPDLSNFAKRGGKMITWHGLADNLIPPGGSVKYYEKVVQHFGNYSRKIPVTRIRCRVCGRRHGFLPPLPCSWGKPLHGWPRSISWDGVGLRVSTG